MSDTSAWLLRPRMSSRARLRLFCLPHAGGGAQMFRGWAAHLPLDIDLCAVQLPGREKRLREPAYARLEPLVEEMARVLSAEIDLPFAIFGHSMGALLGFELARRVYSDLGRQPVRLFVAGHRAPQLPDPDPPIHELSDDEFIAELRRLNGTPPELFEYPELLQTVLPTLRADFTLCETYVFKSGPPLTCAVSAYGGFQDPEARQPSLEAWREQTVGEFRLHMIPGDHFFIHRSAALVLGTVREQLQPVLDGLAD